MAPLVAIAGRDAIFVLSPIAGAVLVWCAFLLARRLAGAIAGATAAVLVAASPIVLFQVVQPMNDIVTAALWLARSRCERSKPDALVAGALTGLAILVRPNLAPVAVCRPAHARWSCAPRASRDGRSVLLRRRVAPGHRAAACAQSDPVRKPRSAPATAAQSALFSTSFLRTNLTQLLTRIYETQTPFPLLALLAPVVFKDRPRAIAWSLLAAAAAVIACYLFYKPYPEWWYLRFQLPAIVLLLVLASAVAVNLAQRANMAGVIPLVAVVLVILAMRVAGDRQVFALQQLEGRYRETAALVRDRLPANAVLITVWQSGGVRFHAGREAVLWDSLDPAWLDRAVAWLTDQGRVPFILLERARGA